MSDRELKDGLAGVKTDLTEVKDELKGGSFPLHGSLPPTSYTISTGLN